MALCHLTPRQVLRVGWTMLVFSHSVCLFTVPAGGRQQVTASTCCCENMRAQRVLGCLAPQGWCTEQGRMPNQAIFACWVASKLVSAWVGCVLSRLQSCQLCVAMSGSAFHLYQYCCLCGPRVYQQRWDLVAGQPVGLVSRCVVSLMVLQSKGVLRLWASALGVAATVQQACPT